MQIYVEVQEISQNKYWGFDLRVSDHFQVINVQSSENTIYWISSTPEVIDDWSPCGHKSGQLVSETAYHMTNL